MNRWDETWHRLQTWTNSSAQAERLAAQVLQADGYSRLDPTHPLGGPDGTCDALAYRDGKRWIMAVYFPHSQKSFSDILKKMKSDCAGVAKAEAIGMAFVTNQVIKKSERARLRSLMPSEVELYHLERIVAILDQPKMQSVRFQFLGIEGIGTKLPEATSSSDHRTASITPREYAFLHVHEMIEDYREFLAPLLHDKALTEETALGVLMCGSPPDYEGPDWQAPWTVFVNAQWLRWYLLGEKSGYNTAIEIPAEQVYGQVPAWPDSFYAFLSAMIETNSAFIWARHEDGYLVLSQHFSESM